ncbi:MAG: hypothetical protein Q4D93_02775 [Porphyromonas sp.]|nr:hypothetical protein [Porphyromonas sp.]
MGLQSHDIISLEDLGELIHPFFNSRAGRRVGKWLLKSIKVDKLNALHSDYAHLEGADFTTAVLQDPRIGVQYRVHGMEHLLALKDKTFITISNHPFGGLDGLILVDIVKKLRPDFKVLVNGFLDRVTALSDSWIPVHPRKNKAGYVHDPSKNVNGIRLLAERVLEEHPVGMFPAGGVAHYDYVHNRVKEQPWQMNNMRILRAARVPILPIMFSGQNSKRFYRLLRISYNLNLLRLPAEILNKKGQTFDVYIGAPIMPDEVAMHKTNKELRNYLMEHCFALL